MCLTPTSTPRVGTHSGDVQRSGDRDTQHPSVTHLQLQNGTNNTKM